jgi:hypothetical protein
VNPGTALVFKGELIGPAGLAGLSIVPATRTAAGALGALDHGRPVAVSVGSDIAPESMVVVTDREALTLGAFAKAGSTLTVVGRGGLNAALQTNLESLTRGGVGGALLGRSGAR